MIIAGKSGVQAQFLAHIYMAYICLQRQSIKYKHDWLFKRCILKKLNTLHVKKMLYREGSGHIRDGPFDFSWGGGGRIFESARFFLDLTDSARLFFIEYCACTIFFFNF